MRQFYLLALSIFFCAGVEAQLATNHSASPLIPDVPGQECYVLTPADLYQKGSVWSTTQVDLTQNFEVFTRLYFGSMDEGADGIAFVLQREGLTYLGNVGAGIGYHRFNDELPDMPTDVPGPVPSFIIEFDTYQNGDILGQDIADPAEDHVAFMSNSNAYHTSPSQLKAPEVFTSNIEDGNWHNVKFSWNAATKTMTVVFTISSSPLLTKTFTYTGDIVNNLFGGNTMVYWGFTASTGSFNPNEHKVCILPPPPPADCGQLRTQTPGGWGAAPRGNNPGTYLHQHFASAFPEGLVVGSLPNYFAKFTSAQAITDYLPAGGQAKSLSQNYLNPTTRSCKNTLVNHLVALTLSVRFDETDPAFGTAGITLGEMIIQSGPFANWSVYNFLAEANRVLGGGSSSFTVQHVLQTASAINENYVDGLSDNHYLACPEASPRETEFSGSRFTQVTGAEARKESAQAFTILPNPSNGQFDVRINGQEGQGEVLVYNTTGVLVERRTLSGSQLQSVKFDLTGKPAGIYLVRVVSGKKVEVRKIVIQK